MSKHTPGTWTQAPYSPTDVIADGGKMIAMAREGMNGIEREEAIANAKLIAAAPDMLAALQGFQAAWDENRLMTSDEAFAIRQAIAKATGEQA